MTENSAVSVSEEARRAPRLDDETEVLIEEYARSFNVIGLDRKSHARQINAGAALRQRIRTLIEEARKAGADAMYLEIDTRGMPHD